MNQHIKIGRAEARRLFSEHRGAAFQLAAEKRVPRSTISMYLRGYSRNKRVAEVVLARAAELKQQVEAA